MSNTTLIADDDQMFLDELEGALSCVNPAKVTFDVRGRATTGTTLMALVKRAPELDWVFTDLRMPVVDGLTALVKIRHKNKSARVFLVTSEAKGKCQTHDAQGDEISFEEGIKLLDRVAARVRNDVRAPGKLCSMLKGCEQLGLDPAQVAKHYGASGYIRKPISAKKLESVVAAVERGETFVEIDSAGRKAWP